MALYSWCGLIIIKSVTDLLQRVQDNVKWVSFQRHKVTVKQMEYFKNQRVKLFSHWRMTERARMLRDDKNGRFVLLSKEDHVITCEGVVLEAAAKKPRKEFAYDGIFDDVC